MPRGPKGQMCAAHVIGNAIMVVRVASAHLLRARGGWRLQMMSLSDTPQTLNGPYRRPS
jgi:hypothetical protein